MLTAEIIDLLRQGQRLFSETVTADLQSIGQGGGMAAYAALSIAGFAYGTLHALGPGHGKAVVSGYVLANQNSLRRGLVIVALSSLLQAAVAVCLVLGFYYLLDATRSQAERAAWYLESFSFLLIGFVGLRLVFQGASLWLPRRGAHDGCCCHEHHDHAHHDHAHHNAHADHACCGHEHMPPAARLTDAGWASMAAMILSIGIRPCTGALFLLFFACMTHLTMAGVAAVFFMAAGTALTTGILAVLAAKSRHLAFALVGRTERGGAYLGGGLKIAAGLFIAAVALLFWLSLPQTGLATPVAHPLYKDLR